MDEKAGVEDRLTAIEERVTELERKNTLPSKDMVTSYEGSEVRTFLVNGVSVSGNAHFDGNWAQIENPQTKKVALCNLSHVVSITKS